MISAAPPVWLRLDRLLGSTSGSTAKAAATSPLDVAGSGAAFCCVSLYKIFGEPSGLGALLVRREASRLLTMRG